MQFTHLRSFPLQFEISTKGHVRRLTATGYTSFQPYRTEFGIFVDIPVNGKINKCLVAEMILYSFSSEHILGNRIKFKDNNKFNIELYNLESVPPDRPEIQFHMPYETKKWGCDSRANNANSRCTSSQEKITPEDVVYALIKGRFSCFYCDEPLDPRNWHLDHFLPICNGGENTRSNLRASCATCNKMKGDQLFINWFIRMQRIIAIHGEWRDDKLGNHPRLWKQDNGLYAKELKEKRKRIQQGTVNTKSENG